AGIAEPTGIEVLGMGAAVHEDLAIGVYVSLDQEDDQLGSLDNLERKRRLARDAGREATRVGIVFREALLAELDGPGLQWELLARLEGHCNVADHLGVRPPDSRQVWFSIRGARG